MTGCVLLFDPFSFHEGCLVTSARMLRLVETHVIVVAGEGYLGLEVSRRIVVFKQGADPDPIWPERAVVWGRSGSDPYHP